MADPIVLIYQAFLILNLNRTKCMWDVTKIVYTFGKSINKITVEKSSKILLHKQTSVQRDQWMDGMDL